MRSFVSHLLIITFCVVILAVHTDSLRIRLPALKISANFRKTTESPKKKIAENQEKFAPVDKQLKFQVPSINPKDGL